MTVKPDQEPQTKEIEDSNGSVHFEYYMPQYRGVYDEMDLISQIL